jgi:hypothetical protein
MSTAVSVPLGWSHWLGSNGVNLDKLHREEALRLGVRAHTLRRRTANASCPESVLIAAVPSRFVSGPRERPKTADCALLAGGREFVDLRGRPKALSLGAVNTSRMAGRGVLWRVACFFGGQMEVLVIAVAMVPALMAGTHIYQSSCCAAPAHTAAVRSAPCATACREW